MELQDLKNMLRIDGSYDDTNLMIHLEAAKSYVLNSVNVKTAEQEKAVKADPRFKMVVGLLAASWYESKTLTSETQQHTLPHAFYPLIQQLDFTKALSAEPEPVEPIEPEPTEPEPVETVEIKINDVAYQATAKNELSFTLLNGETFDTPFLNVDGSDYGVISSTPEQTVLTAIETYYGSDDYGDSYKFEGFVNDSKLYVFSSRDSLEPGVRFNIYILGDKVSENLWNLEEI